MPLSLAALAAAEPGLAETVLAAPGAVLPHCNAALVDAQAQVLAELGPSAERCCIKESVHARVSGPALFLDPGARDASPAAGEFVAAHINHMVTVVGTVARTGAVKMLEARRLFECPRCEHRCVCVGGGGGGGGAGGGLGAPWAQGLHERRLLVPVPVQVCGGG